MIFIFPWLEFLDVGEFWPGGGWGFVCNLVNYIVSKALIFCCWP
jgi:hypothetical protein